MKKTVKKVNEDRYNKSWTPEEDLRLKALLARHSFEETASMLGRSVRGTKARVVRKGYSIGNRYGWYTLGETAGILGVTYYWVRNRIERGMLKGKRVKKGESEKGGAYWVIREVDLRDFIRQYPQDLYNKPIDVVAFVDILCPDGILFKV